MSTTLNEWVAMLGRIGTAGLRQAIKRTAIASALDAEGKAKERLSGEVLSARTGHLRRSIAGSVRESGDLTDIVLGAGGRVGNENVKYARIHEFGGTIRPTVKRWLAIPNTDNPLLHTMAGVARYASPLDVPDLVFRLTRRPDLALLVNRRTNEVWYWLKKQVTIPQRPYLRPSMDEVSAKLSARLGGQIRKEFERAQ